MSHPRSSRQRYRGFVEDYKNRRLDDINSPAPATGNGAEPEAAPNKRAKQRQYVREYLRWLKPHRAAVAGVFGLALITAGLQMIAPLFMRFIIDRVLLDQTLTAAARMARLNAVAPNG